MTQTEKQAPWGFWQTIGLSAVIILSVNIAQYVAFTTYKEINIPGVTRNALLQYFESRRGFFLSLETIIAAPFMIGLAVLFAKVRQRITISDYLCLHKVRSKIIFEWIVVFCVFLIGVLCMAEIMNIRHQGYMAKEYRTAGSVPLLWFTVVVVSPLSEEIVFRGFFFKGIEASKMGAIGAVILSALFWAGLHMQRGIYTVFIILVYGLILGLARFKTKSIFPPLALHSLMNFTSMMLTALQ